METDWDGEENIADKANPGRCATFGFLVRRRNRLQALVCVVDTLTRLASMNL